MAAKKIILVKNIEIFIIIFFISISLISIFLVENYNVDHLVFLEIAKKKSILLTFNEHFTGELNSQFAVHFSPILVLTFIFDSAQKLLLLKFLITLFTALLIFFHIKDKKLKIIILTLPSLYLLSFNSTIHFYENFFAIPIILFSFILFKKKNILLGLLVFTLTFLVKEEFPLIGIGIGIWLFKEFKNIRYLLYSIFSVFAFYIITKLFMPYLADLSGHQLSLNFSRYEALGNSYKDIIIFIIFNPLKVLFGYFFFQKIILFTFSLYPIFLLKNNYLSCFYVLFIPLFYSWISTGVENSSNGYYGSNILYLHFGIPILSLIIGLFIFYQDKINREFIEKYFLKMIYLNLFTFLIFFFYSLRNLVF